MNRKILNVFQETIVTLNNKHYRFNIGSFAFPKQIGITVVKPRFCICLCTLFPSLTAHWTFSNFHTSPSPFVTQKHSPRHPTFLSAHYEIPFSTSIVLEEAIRQPYNPSAKHLFSSLSSFIPYKNCKLLRVRRRSCFVLGRSFLWQPCKLVTRRLCIATFRVG